MWAGIGSMGFAFIIQSLKPPTYLEDRVNSFIETYRKSLANLSTDTFQAQKDALILKLLEAPKNLQEEAVQFWHYIDQDYNDFLQGTWDWFALPPSDIHPLQYRRGGCWNHPKSQT